MVNLYKWGERVQRINYPAFSRHKIKCLGIRHDGWRQGYATFWRSKATDRHSQSFDKKPENTFIGRSYIRFGHRKRKSKTPVVTTQNVIISKK